ncbi:MAG: hypothetical protein C3F19_00825 [Rhodocyclales bacterium]|nr:MAG: hypothetical protein C3F19_00825 [Rhodocyclales bacterium]
MGTGNTPAAAGSIDEFLGGDEPQNRGVLDAVKQGVAGLWSSFGEGSGLTTAGAGEFLQAPAANTLAGLAGLRKFGTSILAGRDVADTHPDFEAVRETARMTSAHAAEERAANVARGGILAALGKEMKGAGQSARDYWRETKQEHAPDMVRQQQEIEQAKGFLPKAGAMITNPLGTAGIVAQSMPDMLIGAGAGSLAAKGVGRAALARGATQEAAEAAAVRAAGSVGLTAEAAASTMHTKQQVVDFVTQQPYGSLFENSERYRELFMTNTPEKARQLLAEELSNESALAAGLWTGLMNKITGSAEAMGKTVATGRTTGKEVWKGTAKEAIEEGTQNPGEEYAAHRAKVQADPTQEFDPGGAIAEGMLTGGPMGFAMHGTGYVGGKIADMGKPGGAGDAGAPSDPGAAPAQQSDTFDVGDVLEQEKPTEAERALLAPKSLTALDRVAEIDQKLAAPDLNEDEAQPLRAEREQITAGWPQAVPGLATTFSTETGVRLAGRYALMDADDLTTSHDTNLRPVAAYPAELQPRERERHASEMQVQQITQKLDPARLGESADVATGAPIVGADGLVESGNARSIALKRVYQANGQKAENYRQFLRDNATRFGVTAEEVESMSSPVLVRVRETPVNRAEFARQANQATVARMSPSEQAKADAAMMDTLDDLQPDEQGDFMSGNSRPFVRRFLAKLPATEQAGMIDAQGNLSQTGYSRIRNAVLARAYGDSPVLLRMTESLDDNLRNVSKALMQVAPQVAKTREAISEGALHDADIAPDLMAAVEELSRLRDAGQSVKESLAQAGMFGDKLAPETRDLLAFLDENIRRPRQIAAFIQRYMEGLAAAGNPNQGTLLGDATAPAKGDLLAAAKRGEDGAVAGITEDTGGRQPGEDQEVGAGTQPKPADAASGQGRDGSDASARQQAAADFRDALNDLGAITRDFAGVARLVPEDHPGLMDALVRLFDAAIRLGYHDAKKAVAYVKEQLRSDVRFKTVWNKILPETYRKAARLAAEQRQGGEDDLLGAATTKSEEIGSSSVDGKGSPDEAAEGGNQEVVTEFVKAPDGSIDFGEITEEQALAMRRQAGKIRLTRGEHNEDGTGHGLAHIEANHGKQIRNAGFESVEAFVSHVATKFNEILQGSGRQLLVAVDGERQDVMFVQLEPDETGDFYRINTAFPASRDYLEKQQRKGMKLLWGGSEPASPVAGQQALYADNPEGDSGQDAPIAQGQSSEGTIPPATTPGNRAGGLVEQTKALFDRLRDGAATLDEFKAGFSAVVDGKESIKSELSALTKDAIFKRFPGLAYRYKNEKKAEVVDAAYRSMLDSFVLGDSISWRMGEKYEDVIRGYVEKTTEESLREFAGKVKSAREEREALQKEAEAGMENPVTLDDYKRILAAKAEEIGEGATFTQARMAMTPEQRQRFDELTAEKSRDERRARADQQKTEVRVAAATTEGRIVETKHTKTGEPLFVVKAAERVERDVYNQWNATAKKMGGWYSSYRAAGAVPGFQFKTRENAKAFLQYLGGDTEQAQSVVQDRRDAFTDDRSQTAVERLNEMADRLDAQADETLSVERKQNTARRARMAAGAEASANADKAMAQTMRNIAAAIESGQAKFLDRVRQKVQIERLQNWLSSARYAERAAKYQTYGEQEKHKNDPPTGETADYAAFPTFTAYRSDLARMARRLLEIDGAKQLGTRLLKVADDVTAEYKKFAKENLYRVSTFKGADGREAVFRTADDAEAAIARSGFKGKATTISFKRGEHLVIMGPEMAKEAGLWHGDPDKRITLTPDLAEEIVAKAKGRDIGMPWTFDAVAADRARLKAMGIETPAEFRAALREFIAMREAPKAPDRVKELERKMIGRANDGLDFFPTPAETAQAMIDAAELKEDMAVLEPSAGWGHIAEKIREAGVEPDVVELAADRRELLEAKGFTIVGSDFIDVDGEYDRIILNPPFSDRRDAEHVQHAYALLKPGGRLVALMGEGVFFGQDKKAQEFREWLESVGGTSEKLEAGTFLDPSLPANTGVNARMVVVDRVGDSGATRLSRNDRPADDGLAFAQTVLSELADVDDLYRYPVSKAGTLEGVMADIDPTITYLREVTRPDEKSETGADKVHMFRIKAGRVFYVFERGNEVWIDVSRLQEGDRGSEIYHAVANYAFNTHKVFIGDPVGLSEAATVRRTSAMLSSVLRFGTTRHFDAAQEQLYGFKAIGVEPLDWSGSDVEKTKALIHTFVKTIENNFPAIDDYHYDFQRGQFYDQAGNPVTLSRFDAAARLSGEARAGRDSLRRAVFLRSLVRETQGRPGILERVLRGGHQFVAGGNVAKLFSRAESGSRGERDGHGLSARDLKAVVSRVAKGFKNLPAVHALESPEQAPKELRDYIEQAGAWDDVEGATHDGEIYLFASGLANEARAEHVLAVHEITHYGLRGVIGKDLDAALQHVWLNNTKVREEAAVLRKRLGLESNVEAVEEVLADLPAADLVKLKGWRKVVKAVRDWMAKAGAKALAARLDAWLTAGMDEQQKADLFVADLVVAAREWVRTGKQKGGAVAMTGTRLADRSTASDAEAQQKWLQREAKARGYKSVDDMAAKNAKAFENLAALWRKKHPVDGARLSRSAPPTSSAPPQQPAGNLSPPLRKHWTAYADRVIGRMDSAINGLHGLPDQARYLADRYLAMGKIGQIDEIAGAIRMSFGSATAEDKKAVYAYLTTRGADPSKIKDAAVRDTAEKTKKYIGTVGDALVARGLIPEASREEYRDRYLPRLYLAHLLDDSSWRAIGAGKKVSDQGYLKERNKDLPEEYRRVILGEVTDPAFLAASAIAQPMRDMAILDWLEKISGNEQWVWKKDLSMWGGRKVSTHWLLAESDAMLERAQLYESDADAKKAEAIANEMRKTALTAMGEQPKELGDYKRLPNTARYGRLRGLLVRREIYDDLIGLGEGIPRDAGWAEKALGQGGAGTKAQQLWKTSKVALNPPGQIRNFISNAVLLQLSGVPLHRLPWLFVRAMREMTDGGAHYQVAKKYGVTVSTFAAQELFRAKRDLLELEREMRGNHPVLAIQRVAAFIMDKAGDAYQWSETVMKTAKIIDAMEREKLSEADAALEAQKWVFDYSLVDRNVRYLRNAPVGMPFLTFSTKVAPRLLEVAAKHPQRFLPWVILHYGMMQAAAMALGGDGDDWDKLRMALPEWLREKPHALPLPWRDSEGRIQFADIGYYFPWQQWLQLAGEVSHGEVSDALRTAGIIGGPLPDLIVAAKTGIDPFTKKEIANDGDPPMERGVAWLNYAWNMAAPPFLTSNGFLSPMGLIDKQYGGKLAQGVTGTTDKYGDPRATTPQAIIGLLGVNIKGIDPSHSRAQELKRLMGETIDSKQRLKQRLQDQSLTPDEKRKIMKLYQDEMGKRAEKLREYSDESTVPEFARPRK